MTHHPQRERISHILRNLKENEFKFVVTASVGGKQVRHDVYHTVDEGKQVTIAFFINETEDVAVSLVVDKWLDEPAVLATIQAREKAEKN